MGTLPAHIERILEVARSQYGVREVPMGSNRGPEVDKYRPEWKRAELARADKEAGRQVPGDPWCAWAATHILHKALKKHVLGSQFGSCHALALAARKRGMWLDLAPGMLHADMGFVAYPGCLFVMLDHPLDDRVGPGHVGIVTAVSHDGGTIQTAEGNTGNAFRAGRRSLGDPKMRGIVLVDGMDHLFGDWPRMDVDALPDLSKEGTR